jgi:hypothetical protein
MDHMHYKRNVQKYFFAEGGSLPLIQFTGNNFMATWDAGEQFFRWTRLVLLDHFEEGSLQHLNYDTEDRQGDAQAHIMRGVPDTAKILLVASVNIRLAEPGEESVSTSREHHVYVFFRGRSNTWLRIDSEEPKPRRAFADPVWISQQLALDLYAMEETCTTRFWHEPNERGQSACQFYHNLGLGDDERDPSGTHHVPQ